MDLSLSDSPAHNSPPTVWCLLGRKAGDNTQLRALAGRLGWPCEEKHLIARSWELLPHLLLGPTLLGIDRRASSPLQAPWPDLVISAGRRNEPVARWIQRQSGGRTRLVHMGRPWAHPDRWDLLVTTPQYFLPERPSILHNRLPLHDPDEAALQAAAAHWRERWQALPRPWIAVLMGGDSGPFVFTAEKGRRLGEMAAALAQRSGGSLLFTDSARTPAAASAACVAAMDCPVYQYLRSEAPDANPYRGMLALADAFVVTGESMSMLAEAHSRGRPLLIFDPADAPPWWRQRHAWRFKPLSHHLAMRFGPRRMRRDVGRIQLALIESGEAVWLRDDSAAVQVEDVPARAALAERELQRAAAAVRGLFTA
jgi:mitochondrial fission protein ELM1